MSSYTARAAWSSGARPLMPVTALRLVAEEDGIAIYRFVITDSRIRPRLFFGPHAVGSGTGWPTGPWWPSPKAVQPRPPACADGYQLDIGSPREQLDRLLSFVAEPAGVDGEVRHASVGMAWTALSRGKYQKVHAKLRYEAGVYPL